jgi:hypothetical protein
MTEEDQIELELEALEAFDLGFFDYQHDLSIRDNPYDQVTEWDLYQAWRSGWEEACFDDLQENKQWTN